MCATELQDKPWARSIAIMSLLSALRKSMEIITNSQTFHLSNPDKTQEAEPSGELLNFFWSCPVRVLVGKLKIFFLSFACFS